MMQQVLWRAHLKNLFEEIIENGGPYVKIASQPLRISYSIIAEAAQRAIELQDEKLISIFCRLAMYEESDPTSEKYDDVKMQELYQKYAVKEIEQ